MKIELNIKPSDDRKNSMRKANTQLRSMALRIEESQVSTFDNQKVTEYKYTVYIADSQIEDLESIINDMLVELPISLIVNDTFFKAKVNSTVDLNSLIN